MYSCPTDDIHSLYVDNELPAAYRKDYEEHIATCKSCAKKVESYRRIKNAFKKDSSTITLSSEEMDASFERLSTKLRYKTNTTEQGVHRFPAEIARWSIAAAAIVAAAIVPVSISTKNSTKTSQVASIAPVARPQNIPISNQSVVLNGNINGDYAMPVGTAGPSDFHRGGPDGFRPPRMRTRGLNSSLTNVDVLRPDFEEPNKISIKINVPGLEQENDSIEIKLPVNMLPDSISEQN